MAVAVANYSGRKVIYGLGTDADPTTFSQFVGVVDDLASNTMRVVFSTYDDATSQFSHTTRLTTDSGVTWTTERVRPVQVNTSLGETGERPQAHHRCPNGTMLRRTNYEDLGLRSKTVEMERSSDQGATWVSAGAGSIGCGLGAVAAQVQKVITLADGSILACGQNFNQTAGLRKGVVYARPLLQRSTDNGATWANAVALDARWGVPGDPTDTNPAVNCPSRIHPNEGCPVELGDGALGIMWRTGPRPWNGTDVSSDARSSVLTWMVLPKLGTGLWDWEHATFVEDCLGIDMTVGTVRGPTCPDVRRTVIATTEVLVCAFRQDPTSPKSFYTSTNRGATWQPLVLPGAALSNDEPYYAQIRIKAGGTPRLHIFGHKGFANVPGEREMGIIYHAADLTLTGAGTVPAAPTITPAGGLFAATQTVTITGDSTTTSIRYTTDGSTPTASSTLYSAPITVTQTQTVKAIALNGSGSSPVTTASFTIDAVAPPAPTISPAGGTFAAAQQVTMADAEAGVEIRYTTDGSTPTRASSLYGGAITVSATQTLRAVAVDAVGNVSPVTAVSFTITGAGASTGIAAARSPTTIVNDTARGQSAWINPANALADDTSYAICTLGTVAGQPADVSNGMVATGFGFTTDTSGQTIPDTAQITKIVVGMKRIRIGAQQIKDDWLSVRFPDGTLGTDIIPDPATIAAWSNGTVDSTVTFTISAPGVTGAQLKAAGFGVYYQAMSAGTDADAKINRIWIDSVEFTRSAAGDLSAQIAAATSLLEVDAGIYPRLSVANVNKIADLIVRPKPGARVVVDGGDFTDSSGIYFEGIEWTGQKEINQCHHIEWRAGCDFSGFNGVQWNVDVSKGWPPNNSHHLKITGCQIHDATWVPDDPLSQSGPTCINFRRAVRDSEVSFNTITNIRGFDFCQWGGWVDPDGIAAHAGMLPMGNNICRGNQATDVNKGSTLAHSDFVQLTGCTDGCQILSNTLVRSRGFIVAPSSTGGWHKNLVVDDNETDVSDFLFTGYNCPNLVVTRNRAPNASLTSDNGGIRINHTIEGATDHFTENVTLVGNNSRRISQFDSSLGTVTYKVLDGVVQNYGNTFQLAGGTYVQPVQDPAPAPPTIFPDAGSYSAAQNVTISAPGAAAVRYTTDGSTPSITSALYTGPITVSSSTTIRAVAVSATGKMSGVTTSSFVIGTSGTTRPPRSPFELGQPLRAALNTNYNALREFIDQVNADLQASKGNLGGGGGGVFAQTITLPPIMSVESWGGLLVTRPGSGGSGPLLAGTALLAGTSLLASGVA